MTRLIRLKRGLDIPLAGEPEQAVYPGNPVCRVALCGPDYPGLRPRMLVAEGQRVASLEPLFTDKRDPAVNYCVPGQGTVSAINRGPQRALHSVVVELDQADGEPARFKALNEEQLGLLDRDEVVGRLLPSGLWTALRQRPFGQVPHSESTPQAIFVTATDTRPLAADPLVAVRAEIHAFAAGLQIVSRLTPDTVYLCVGPGWDIELPNLDRVLLTRFSGPHPAGLPGTHIHHLFPVGPGRVVWHLGYQDLIAIGKLFLTGSVDPNRIVALGGSPVVKPRLLATRLGASIEELTRREVTDAQSSRVVSGSVLGGRHACEGLAFLGRYHDQVSVIEEGGDSHLFGWAGLYPRRYSAVGALRRRPRKRRRFAFSTSQNGRFAAMLPTREFEKVMPLDVLPSPLFRALLVRDSAQAQALGCLELDEEDVALCSFVCPAKIDYGAALRVNLDQILREGS